MRFADFERSLRHIVIYELYTLLFLRSVSNRTPVELGVKR